MAVISRNPIRKEFLKTAKLLMNSQKVVLASHLNPDGDALGSLLALAHLLRGMGKEVTPISTDGVPAIYQWMPGSEMVVTATDKRDFDLAIVVDAGAIERIGTSQLSTIHSAKLLIDIDHHVADTVFGDVRILDSTSASTAEIICRLIQTVNRITQKEWMTPEIANCLMTGVITDTGSFKYPNTTPSTFKTAAYLQSFGAKPAPINELVYENRSLASLKLQARALNSLQISTDGKIAWTCVSAKDMEECGATDADTEGIVGLVRGIDTVQAALFFREIVGKKIRISLRAREGADVNKIANVFGGGGHRLAAGCSIEPPLELAIQTVVAEATRQVRLSGK